MLMDAFNLAFFMLAFSSLFTIISPISTSSVFITITPKNSKKEKLQMAKKASITAALVLIVFGLAGNYILSFFNITLEAFRIAGGILVAGVGLQMLHTGKKYFRSEEEEKEAIRKDDVSIIPLAIPLMSGPGAMTTTIVLIGKSSGLTGVATVIFAIVLVCWLAYLILSRASIIERYLDRNSRQVIEKLMGLIVLVIGVQFIINGLQELLVIWAPLLRPGL